MCPILNPKSKIENPKLVDRQREIKPAAFAEFAFKPDPAAVHFDEPLRQRKSQAGALRFAGFAARLLKFEKDSFLIFCRDSGSSVADLDAHVSILRACPHPDLTPFRRKLDRISYEIQQHLLDSR